MDQTPITSDTLSRALAPGGTLARDFNVVWNDIWRQDHVPPEALELARLRLAQLHGATAEFGGGPLPESDPARIEAVRSGRYASDPAITPAERAVLEFTEVYAQDPMALTDELADGVKAHFGEPGLVCLVEALGFIEGRIRLGLMFSALASTPN